MGQILASGQRSPLDRSESMPAYDIAEVLWDPQSQGLGMMPVVPVTPDGHGNGNSNLNGNGIDFDGSRRAEGSNWRARQGSSFQPKSDFFRSFDKALRGGRTGMNLFAQQYHNLGREQLLVVFRNRRIAKQESLLTAFS